MAWPGQFGWTTREGFGSALCLCLGLIVACSRSTATNAPPAPSSGPGEVVSARPAGSPGALRVATDAASAPPATAVPSRPPAQATGESNATTLALKKAGKVRAWLADGATVDLADGVTVTVLDGIRDASECLGTPHGKVGCDFCLCIQMSDGRRVVADHRHIIGYAGEFPHKLDHTPWRFLHIELDQGDCASFATWLLGPAGERKLLSADQYIGVSVYRDRMVLADETGTQILPLPDAQTEVRSTVTGSFPELHSAAWAPDGKLWLRSAELLDPFRGEESRRRDASVWRVIAGKPQLVWKIRDQVVGDYDCRGDPPDPVEFSPDGNKLAVDGKWREVPR